VRIETGFFRSLLGFSTAHQLQTESRLFGILLCEANNSDIRRLKFLRNFRVPLCALFNVIRSEVRLNELKHARSPVAKRFRQSLTQVATPTYEDFGRHFRVLPDLIAAHCPTRL
jgi:hypothetical protein